jgi:hypothetical protein
MDQSWKPGPLTWIEVDDWQEAAERGQCFTLADADSNDVADIYHNNHATVPTTPEQAAAYARLFAAAPLMAEALETTAKNICSLGPAGALAPTFECYRPWLELVEAALAAARSNKEG